jgi:hypothetical protein
VLKYHENIDDLMEKHAKLEADLSITVSRLGMIEKKLLNGGAL